LDGRNLSLDDVTALLEETVRSNMTVPESLQVNMSLTTSKLSIPDLKEALSYRAELDELGFPAVG